MDSQYGVKHMVNNNHQTKGETTCAFIRSLLAHASVILHFVSYNNASLYKCAVANNCPIQKHLQMSNLK